jgi:hypothetical protein
MRALTIGDRVKVGRAEYSEVFMFTHKDPHFRTHFKALRCKSGHVIKMTPGHYVYLNGALAAAGSAKARDKVMLGNGEVSEVVEVSDVVETGLYNPQTVHGDIVVDGVVASTYTTAVSPTFAHAWLSPLRFLYGIAGVSGGVYENGADSFAAVLPDGLPTC